MAISVNPPTCHLPPIKTLSQCSTRELFRAVTYLRLIYNPEVRGIRRTGHKNRLSPLPSSPPPPIQDAAEHETLLDELRADAFERSYAIRWLTALVTSEAFYEPTEGQDAGEGDGREHDSSDEVEREALVRDSASLLAICAGTASAGTLTRVFRFPLPNTYWHSRETSGDDHISFPSEGREDERGAAAIEVQLTDVPLENQDYASVGAQTWGSACLLSEMLVESPESFGLVLEVERGDASREFRALELGAGTGLVSLTLAKWWESVSGFNKREQEVEGKAAVEAKGVNKAEFEDRGCSDGDGTEISTASSNSLDLRRRRSCTVVATDFHPSVLANLHRNIEANFDFPFSCARSQSHPLPSQWQSTPSCPPSSHAAAILNSFTATTTTELSDSHTHKTTAPVSIVDVGAHFLDWSQFSQDPVLAHSRDASGNAVSDNCKCDKKFQENSVIGAFCPSPPFDEPFDLILGADIIYEAKHAQWIKACLEKLLKKPSSLAPTSVQGCGAHHHLDNIVQTRASSTSRVSSEKIGLNSRHGSDIGCTSIDVSSDSPSSSSCPRLHSQSYATQCLQPRFHLVIPLRPTHMLESKTIETVFPCLRHITAVTHDDPAKTSYNWPSVEDPQVVASDTMNMDLRTDNRTMLAPVSPLSNTSFPSDISMNGTAPSTYFGHHSKNWTSELTLAILRKESIVCEVDPSLKRGSSGRGRADSGEVEYVHYVIGWVSLDEVGP